MKPLKFIFIFLNCIIFLNVSYALPPYENPVADNSYSKFKAFVEDSLYAEDADQKFVIAQDIAIDCTKNSNTNIVSGGLLVLRDGGPVKIYTPQKTSEELKIGNTTYPGGYRQRQIYYTSSAKPIALMLKLNSRKYEEYKSRFYSPLVNDEETIKYLNWLDALDFRICFQTWPESAGLGRGIFDVELHGSFMKDVFDSSLRVRDQASDWDKRYLHLHRVEIYLRSRKCEKAREDYEEKVDEWRNEHALISSNFITPSNLNGVFVGCRSSGDMQKALKKNFHDECFESSVELSAEVTRFFENYKEYVMGYMNEYNHSEMAFLYDLDKKAEEILGNPDIKKEDPLCLFMRTRLSCCHRCETFLYAYYDYLKTSFKIENLYFIIFYDEIYNQEALPVVRNDRKVWFLQK